MKFTGLRPLLWTENLDETISFYMLVLGFELLARNDEWQWASLRKDDVYIMVSQPNKKKISRRVGSQARFILM